MNPPSSSSETTSSATATKLRAGDTLGSCTRCRHRKIKCNRELPCNNCLRLGIECVPWFPTRNPRGRKGGRPPKNLNNTELLARLNKLEKLVSDTNKPQQPAPDPELQRYLGASFWTTLTEGLDDIRDALAQSDDEEDSSYYAASTPSSFTNSTFMFGSVRPVIPPTRHQIYSLCDTFLTNVDPLFKILHAPSLRRHLQEDSPTIDCSPGPRGHEALRYAVYFGAVVSMTPETCRERFGEERASLLENYRAGTEQGLVQADFLNTMDLSTLQALVIFLTPVRVDDSTRTTWTLTALAVRIANAMGLHAESAIAAAPPFEREMRRRLWYQICILDNHASNDRATPAIILANSYDTKLPVRTNDADISPASTDLDLVDHDGYTDMTFSLICAEIYGPTPMLMPGAGPQNYTERRQLIIDAHERVQQRHLRHLNLANPFHWATRMVADVIISYLWFALCRPFAWSPTIACPLTERQHCPDVLALAVEVLERFDKMSTNPAASSMRWVVNTFVQWHALAVAGAELCIRTEGPLVERAWAVMDSSMERSARYIADTDNGMLWRPIRKLVNKARAVRKESTTPVALDPTLGMSPFDWASWTAPPEVEPSVDEEVMAWTKWTDFVGNFQGDNIDFGMPE